MLDDDIILTLPSRRHRHPNPIYTFIIHPESVFIHLFLCFLTVQCGPSPAAKRRCLWCPGCGAYLKGLEGSDLVLRLRHKAEDSQRLAVAGPTSSIVFWLEWGLAHTPLDTFNLVSISFRSPVGALPRGQKRGLWCPGCGAYQKGLERSDLALR